MNDKDEVPLLSSEDDAKLVELQTQWEQGDKEVFARLAKQDPALFLRICAALFPEKVRAAVEEHLIDEGLTNADIHAMLAEALKKN